MLTKKILTEINARRSQKKSRDLWQFAALGAGVAVLAALLLFSYTLALALLLAGASCVWLLYKRDQAAKTSSLTYNELDEESKARLAAIQEACEALALSEKIWRIPGRRDRATKPRSANGAAPAKDRQSVEVGRLETPGISTNVDIWGIDVVGEDLKVFFFPEGVLLYQKEWYRAISYESLEVDLSTIRFVEDEEVPKDAEVVDHTWRYTKEDGSQDKRYKPNPRLPVVLYELLRISGPSDLAMSLQVSNKAAAARFAGAFGVKAPEEDAEQREGAEKRPRGTVSGSETWSETWSDRKQERAHRSARNGSAREKRAEEARAEAVPEEYGVLGLERGTSMSEIITAYRKLAQTYHPDKVAHLSPEVREFADSKMKEINAAYAELKRQIRERPPLFDGRAANNGGEGEDRQ